MPSSAKTCHDRPARVQKKIDGTPLNQPPRHCFAIDRARYVGEPVALVVAESEEQQRLT